MSLILVVAKKKITQDNCGPIDRSCKLTRLLPSNQTDGGRAAAALLDLLVSFQNNFVEDYRVLKPQR